MSLEDQNQGQPVSDIPTAAQSGTQSPISANYDKTVDIKEMKFGFRKVTDPDTQVETKRATIEVKVPVPSVEGIINILNKGGEELDLLLSAVYGTISDQIKERVGNDTTITSENFPYAEFTWEAIANQPEVERKGRGIPKETWEDFIKDYILVMPGLTNKPVKAIEKQAAILAQKMQPLRVHEAKERLLPQFKTMLTIYMSGSANAEAYVECIEVLNKKIDTFLKSDTESNLEQNLGFE